MMNSIRTIIFDFDGVIKESVDVKTHAFAEIYKQYGIDIVAKVINHHIKNGGMSRFEKFRYYHKQFLNKNINNEEVNILAEIFSKKVMNKVIESSYVKGAMEFLINNFNNYNFFISTGTPTYEMKLILDKCSIRNYFTGVYGSPEQKMSHVYKILKDYKYNKEQVVFVGDAITDKLAANEHKIHFIARVVNQHSNLLNEPHKINDLTQLEECILKLM